MEWFDQVIDYLKENGEWHSPAEESGSLLGNSIKNAAVYLWDNSIPYVRWVCTFASVLGILAFIVGWKKGKYVSSGSFTIFLFIKMLDYLFKG